MARRPREPWLLAASLHVYRLMLWLYPPPFRRAWGADMAQLFDDLCIQAWRCRGMRGLLTTWATTLADLAVSLPREHLARVIRGRRRRRRRRILALAQGTALQGTALRGAIGSIARTGSTTMQIRDRFRRLFIHRHRASQWPMASETGNPMSFSRFTERARKVMSLAQEEAQQFQHNYIGTEHMLVGLVREGEGVGAQALRALGVDLDRVRQEVEFIIGQGHHQTTGEIGLTPRAKRIVQLALEESHAMGHHYIGTEHVLLGMVREGQGIAAGVLEKLGVQLDRVRAEELRILGETEQRKRDGGNQLDTPPPDPPTA